MVTTEAPSIPVGVEGEELLAHWVGNALIRNGFKPSVSGPDYINVCCVAPNDLRLALPGGRLIKVRNVAEMLSAVKQAAEFENG